MEPSDLSTDRCLKFDGDGDEYPFYLGIVGQFLLIQGSSDSSQFKSSGATYGHFLLCVKKDLQDLLALSDQNAQEVNYLTWSNPSHNSVSFVSGDIKI